MNRAYPPELEAAERRALLERRKAAGHAAGEGQKPDDKRVGFGLSGGGIRSATFALGLFQALARARIIRKIDFLSTVSGGGYFGSFLGRLFTRDNSELAAAGASGDKPAVAKVEEIVANPHAPPLNWLRENGRYLAPNGSGDTMLYDGLKYSLKRLAGEGKRRKAIVALTDGLDTEVRKNDRAVVAKAVP